MSMTLPRPLPWVPVRLGPTDTSILSSVLVIAALIRGLDYLTGPDAWPPAGVRSPSLIGIEAAFPLWVWGVALVACAILLFVGMFKRWHFPVFLAHSLLGVLYVGLFFGLFVGYASVPFLDGMRGTAGLLVPAVYCLVVASRMGSTPTIPPLPTPTSRG